MAVCHIYLAQGCSRKEALSVNSAVAGKLGWTSTRKSLFLVTHFCPHYRHPVFLSSPPPTSSPIFLLSSLSSFFIPSPSTLTSFLPPPLILPPSLLSPSPLPPLPFFLLLSSSFLLLFLVLSLLSPFFSSFSFFSSWRPQAMERCCPHLVWIFFLPQLTQSTNPLTDYHK